MNCTRCQGTGFLNIDQLPDELADRGIDEVLAWIKTPDGDASDVSICDCCGDTTGWYGEPGSHYGGDPAGPDGPYAYNGGLCECH